MADGVCFVDGGDVNLSIRPLFTDLNFSGITLFFSPLIIQNHGRWWGGEWWSSIPRLMEKPTIVTQGPAFVAKLQSTLIDVR